MTVFSAPNYCGEFDNSGAMMSVSESLMCSFKILKPLSEEKADEQEQKEKVEEANGSVPELVAK